MSFKAVLFDCDGVLVDSEGISKRVLLEQAAEVGVNLDSEDAQSRFVGRRMAECIDDIRDRLGLPLPEDFYDRFREREYATLRQQVEVIAGVDELLDALQDQLHIPFCVASNGPQEKMQATLGATGLISRFEGRVFSAYDIDDFKPSPGIYLHAAKVLDIDPKHCLVVEDSIVGASAGIAAGMAVAVHAPTAQREAYPSAVHSYVDSMTDIAALVAQ